MDRPARDLATRGNLRTGLRGNFSLRSDGAVAALLILLAVLPYANTLGNGFVYDDREQLEKNPYIYDFRHLKEIFSTTAWSFQGAQGITNYYRPIMTLGYLLCYKLFGLLPFGFHLVNLVLHASAVCLLFAVSRRMFGDAGLALVAAAVFALHPVHTESVAWVAGVTDLELTVFCLLTFWLFLRLGEARGNAALLLELAMAGSFGLAVLSKEQALTLPLLTTLYEHFCRDDRAQTGLARKVSRYAALWLLAGAYLVYRMGFLGGLVPRLQRPALGWSEVLLSGIALVGQYVEKLLWPARLCAFYVFRKSTTLLDPRVLAGLAALLVCAALFLSLWRRNRRAWFALLWLLVTLGPVLNARWMAGNVFAERYLYLPSVGFSWLAGWVWVGLRALTPPENTLARRALSAALGLILALYAVRTFTRNPDWRTDMILYTRTLEASPDAHLIRINLGALHWAQGNIAAAEREWREVLKIAPDQVINLSNLGLLLTRQKRYQEAVGFFERAIRLKPELTDAHLNLAAAYAEMGLRDQAEAQLRIAVTLSPLDPEARKRLGKFCFDVGRLAEAEEQFHLSVSIIPSVEAWDSLGEIYLAWGDSTRAEHTFQRALALNPFDTQAHFRLGALYAASGRYDAAVREYETGLQLDPANPEARAALRALSQPRSAATPEP